jgi:hypothetical protein
MHETTESALVRVLLRRRVGQHGQDEDQAKRQ